MQLHADKLHLEAGARNMSCSLPLQGMSLEHANATEAAPLLDVILC